MVENILLIGTLIAFFQGLRLIYLGMKVGLSPYFLTETEKFNREMNLFKAFLLVLGISLCFYFSGMRY